MPFKPKKPTKNLKLKVLKQLSRKEDSGRGRKTSFKDRRADSNKYGCRRYTDTDE